MPSARGAGLRSVVVLDTPGIVGGAPLRCAAMTAWTEVGDRVFVSRYAFYNQNIGVVLGDESVLLVDTRLSHRQAEEIKADLASADDAAGRRRRQHPRPLATTASATTRSGRPPIWGHERCVTMIESDRRAAAPGRRSQRSRSWRRSSTRSSSTRPTGRSRRARPSRSSPAAGRSSSATSAAATPTTTSWSSSPTPTSCSPATSSRPTRRRSSATASDRLARHGRAARRAGRPARSCPATAPSATGRSRSARWPGSARSRSSPGSSTRA